MAVGQKYLSGTPQKNRLLSWIKSLPRTKTIPEPRLKPPGPRYCYFLEPLFWNLHVRLEEKKAKVVKDEKMGQVKHEERMEWSMSLFF